MRTWAGYPKTSYDRFIVFPSLHAPTIPYYPGNTYDKTTHSFERISAVVISKIGSGCINVERCLIYEYLRVSDEIFFSKPSPFSF